MKYGRYNIISELGKGSMGVVYKAHDPQINRSIALKVLREDRLTSEDYVKRFLKEATAIGRLSHYGIVTVYDIGQDHGTIYIAMELLQGQPLDQKYLGSQFDLEEIVKVGTHVSRALHYAHKMGIVHRDIKPPNIICTDEGTIKVTDFGIAHIDDPDGQQMTRAGEILGTPVYMAPEQILGQPVDGRTDLYSLGVILYEITTGQRPFQGENLASVFRAITNDDPLSPNQLNREIPDKLSKSILKAMARNPADRFASGHDLADSLNQCLERTDKPVTVQPPPQKTSHRIQFILIALFLLSGAGLGGYYFSKTPQTVENNESSQVSKDAHKPMDEIDDLVTEDNEQNFDQLKKRAAVTINSYPEGAKLYLNGEYQGRTPLELRTTATKQEAKLELPGHLDWKAQVDFSKGGDIPLSIRLIPE